VDTVFIRVPGVVCSADPVVLALIPFDYRPVFLFVTLVGFLSVGYIYWSSNKETIPIPLPASEPEPVSVDEALIVEIVNPKPEPLYFDTDKGKVIKTICIDGFHRLPDIRKYSGVEDYRFWDAFYELFADGELEVKESRHYLVREDIKKQWLDYVGAN
jgi:hypothetical protein